MIKTLNKMKQSANYWSMFNINSKVLSSSMRTIPIQNQEFRKEFMRELLNNPELLEAINDDSNNTFKRNLFVRK